MYPGPQTIVTLGVGAKRLVTIGIGQFTATYTSQKSRLCAYVLILNVMLWICNYHDRKCKTKAETFLFFAAFI